MPPVMQVIISVSLDDLLLPAPVQDRKEEGNDGGAQPEVTDIGEVMDPVHDVVVQQHAGDQVLQAGRGLGGHADDAEGGAGGLTGNQIHGHETAEEADQHADCNSKEHHRKDVDPAGRAAEEEERQ